MKISSCSSLFVAFAVDVEIEVWDRIFPKTAGLVDPKDSQAKPVDPTLSRPASHQTQKQPHRRHLILHSYINYKQGFIKILLQLKQSLPQAVRNIYLSEQPMIPPLALNSLPSSLLQNQTTTGSGNWRCARLSFRP
jgi:hypothetical protein